MEETKDSLILRQLVLDYRQIAFQYQLQLQIPVITLTENTSLWGRWDPLRRTIELQRRLVYDYSWDTVLYVLKHEMAHQIVTEVFKSTDSGHQESFHKACDLLHLPNYFRRGSGDLSREMDWQCTPSKNDKITTIIQKIQKLFSLASSKNSAEATLALERAQELMCRYNIDESLVRCAPENFKYIVIDTGKSRLGPIYGHLASLLIEHYNVDVIFTSTFNVQQMKRVQSLEIYGRESYVVVAEYVFYYLLRTLEDLWSTYSGNIKGRTLYLKKSYQLGVLKGFSQALTQVEDQMHQQSMGLIRTKNSLNKEDRERRDFMKLRYPKLSLRSKGRSALDRTTYGQGLSQGQTLDIRDAISRARPQRLLRSPFF